MDVYAFGLTNTKLWCLRMKWKRKKSVWMYGKRILTHSLHSVFAWQRSYIKCGVCIFMYIRLVHVYLYVCHACSFPRTWMPLGPYTYTVRCRETSECWWGPAASEYMSVCMSCPECVYSVRLSVCGGHNMIRCGKATATRRGFSRGRGENPSSLHLLRLIGRQAAPGPTKRTV